MSTVVAKIAVSAATYWIDKPYTYLIPDEYSDAVKPGCRVYVPFSRSNRICEGIILSLDKTDDVSKLKEISSVLDDEPIISTEQIKLALFMRERFFCTIYDAVKTMLPVGLWINDFGQTRVKDKEVEFVRLEISAEDAVSLSEQLRKKSPKQSAILRELSVFGEIRTGELLSFLNCSKPSLNALEKAGYVSYIKTETFRRPEINYVKSQSLPVLNDEQNTAFTGICSLVDKGEASVSLLHGVTGSGKTSVYVHLIDRILKAGKSAILLVPEIALTPQMLKTFSSYFGEEVAVLHSSLTAAERYDEWKRVKQGKAHLAIGTRSAIFAPVENLGIIIIDEEQEETYKSDNTPRYNAEDIAKFRIVKANCPLVLGSATPKVTSRYYSQIGKYNYFRLNNRFNQMSLPQVSIVDMKKELINGNDSVLSSFLRDEIQKNIDNGEQSILFLNRRGANKLITCGTCGFTYKCPNCSVSLTYHSVNNKVMCHYCGYTLTPAKFCTTCGGTLRYIGAGTQLLEEELNLTFPDSRVLRMDTDVLSKSLTHEMLFEKFKNENIPILIGTQMVTKGLNFENVTLVGVVSADQSLYSGDYRASERTFSLITQVVGRSGRGTKPGRAVIQTFTPENETIMQAASQDYDSFYDSEIIVRRIENAPPFYDYISITVSGDSEYEVIQACNYIKKRLKFSVGDTQNIDVIGPAPLMIVKVNNRFRYRVLLRCNIDKNIRRIVSALIIEFNKDKRFKNLSVYADNDIND